MLGFIYTTAFRDFLRPKRVAAWLVIVALVGLFGRLLLTLASNSSPSDVYVMASTYIIYNVLTLAAVIFATSVHSAEIEQKTIVYLVTRPIPRWMILLGRILAASTIVALIGIAACVAVSLGAFGTSGLQNQYMLRDLRGVVMGAIVLIPLFVLPTLWFNRGNFFNLFYGFAWSTIVPSIPGDLKYSVIATHLGAITERPVSDSTDPLRQAVETSAGMMVPSQSWQVLWIVFAVSTALSLWWFGNFEFLPREEGD